MLVFLILHVFPGFSSYSTSFSGELEKQLQIESHFKGLDLSSQASDIIPRCEGNRICVPEASCSENRVAWWNDCAGGPHPNIRRLRGDLPSCDKMVKACGTDPQGTCVIEGNQLVPLQKLQT